MYAVGMKTTKKKKARMGRPPKPPAEKFSEKVTIKMTRAERTWLEAKARKEGLSLSALLMGPWRERR